MQGAFACLSTVGELAVLRIVGDEFHGEGTCDRSLGEIASRAGVCRKLAQLTLRMAARDGLITFERGPRAGRKNLTNVVRIISTIADLAATPKPSARRRPIAVQGEKISCHGNKF